MSTDLTATHPDPPGPRVPDLFPLESRSWPPVRPFLLTRISVPFPHQTFLCLAPWGSPHHFLFPSSELFPTAHCETPVCRDLLSLYLASGNTSVAPCTDFFSFACGNTNRTTSSFQALAKENKHRLQRILGKEIRVEDSLAVGAAEPRMITAVPSLCACGTPGLRHPPLALRELLGLLLHHRTFHRRYHLSSVSSCPSLHLFFT